MNNITRSLKLKFLTLLFSLPLLSISQSTATYTVTFNSIWNSTDHGTLPGNAHWSKLVGVNHNNNISFVGLGQIATAGIKKVAEKGENDIFESEVNAEISNGNAEQYIDGNSLSTATGNVILNNLQISENYPLLTLVSMIAPSPDWMIMADNINLRENNQWKTSITLDLYPTDAGTDSGTSYTAGNIVTNPQVPISIIQNMYGFNDQKIGTITITLNEALSASDFSTTETTLQVFPNPSIDGKVGFNSKLQNIQSITFYNVLGKKVDSRLVNSKTTETHLNHLDSGVYIAKITLFDNTEVVKRIVLK
jgi:hypothetical protein